MRIAITILLLLVAPSLALAQGAVYYGTSDATQLFVMLVHELWRWGVPLEELWPLLPSVDAALGWVAGPGDPAADGDHPPLALL